MSFRRARILPELEGIPVPIIITAIACLAIHFLFVFVLRKEAVADYDVLNRMWGFDSLVYLPAVIVSILYVSVLMLCIPRYNQLAYRAVASFAPDDVIAFLKSHKREFFFLSAVAALLLVYYYKPYYSQFFNAHARANQSVQRNFQSTEYLSMLLTYRFHRFLGYFAEIPLSQSIALLSALAAALYMFVSLLLSDELGTSIFAKCSIFLFQMSSGLLVLFSGHIGSYAIVAAAILIYLYASVLCLRNRLNIVVPLTAAIISVGFNLLSLALIPSFLTLLYLRHWKTRFHLRPSTAGALALIAVVCTVELYGYALRTNGIPVLPLTSDTASLSLSDPRRLWEFLNGQILVSGCGFFLFIYLIGRAIFKRDRSDPVHAFLMMTSFFLIGMIFVWDVPLGSWEWPVNGIAAAGYNVAASYALLSVRKESEPQPKLMYVLVLLIVFNLCNALPWLVVNASEKSIDRVEQMIIHDPGSFHKTTSSPLLELTLFSYQNGRKDQALQFASRGIAENPHDPRSYSNLSILLRDIGRLDQAAAIMRGTIEKFPGYAPAYKELIELSEKRGDHETSYIAAGKLYGLFVQRPRPFLAAIGKERVLSYFSFLEKVERNELKNIARADSILSQIQLLQKQMDR